MNEVARAEIRNEVASIAPFDEIEKQTKEETLAWIDSGAELFRVKKPDVPGKHLVSYFLLVDGDWVLLVDHINAELWLPTGGHVDMNEHPRTTVMREAKEELGIQAEFSRVKPIFLTCTETVGKTSGHWDVSLWYWLKGDRSQPMDFDGSEFNSIEWYHKNDIPFDRSDPELHRFMKKLAKVR